MSFVVVLIVAVVAIICVDRLRPIGFDFFQKILPLACISQYFDGYKKRKKAANKLKMQDKNVKNILKLRKTRENKCAQYCYLNFPRKSDFIIFRPHYYKLNFATKVVDDFKNEWVDCFDFVVSKLPKNTKYRGENGEAFIQTLANNLALSVVQKEKFNAVLAFNEFRSNVKVLKKEEKVFYYLFCLALLVIVNALFCESLKFEKLIYKGAFARRVKENSSPMKIYGARALNKNSTAALIGVSPQKIKKSIFRTLNYFEDLKKQFKIIGLWLRFLRSKKFI